jgi:hypothetical protein
MRPSVNDPYIRPHDFGPYLDIFGGIHIGITGEPTLTALEMVPRTTIVLGGIAAR